MERAQIKLERYRASVLQAACEGRLVPTEAALARHVGEDRDHPRDHPYEPADQLLERILVERRRKWEEERWAYEIERAKKKAAQAERKAAGLPYYIRELEPEHWQDRTPEEYETLPAQVRQVEGEVRRTRTARHRGSASVAGGVGWASS